MLAELAAFNLAVATVKEAAQHSGDIVQIFKGMGEMMTAKNKVQSVVTEKGQSDLEAYAAHAKMREETDKIHELLKWTGHWEPYLDFCRQRRAQEKEAAIQAANAKKARKKKIAEIVIAIVVVFGVLCAVGILVGLIYVIKTKGRFT